MITLRCDVSNPAGTLVARFEEDQERGALYLLTLEEDILGIVKCYDKAEWPDVGEAEVSVWWNWAGPIERCLVNIRGRTRYVDVQMGDMPAGVVVEQARGAA